MSEVTYIKVTFSFPHFNYGPNGPPNDGWWGFPLAPLMYGGTDITSMEPFDSADVPFAAVSHGSWGPLGFAQTGQELVLFRQVIADVIVQDEDEPLSFKNWSGGKITYDMFDDLFQSPLHGEHIGFFWTTVADDVTKPHLFDNNANSRDLDSLSPRNFDIGSASFSLSGNDSVTLPSTPAKWSKWGQTLAPDDYATFHAGLGSDTVTGAGLKEYISGDQGNDTLKGLNGDDGLEGNAGNDEINGGLGNDNLWGNEGDDTIIGSAVTCSPFCPRL